jgi:transposase InsO family protein
MKTESEGAETLADFVRDYGAPYHIRSDNAKMETGHAFTAICRKYNIKQSTTEPHHPQQNPAERQIQDVKRQVNLIMDRVGCPDMLWLLATKYVVYLLNRTATKSLEWKTPIEQAFGDTPDISNLLQFSFWELVYYWTLPKDFL